MVKISYSPVIVKSLELMSISSSDIMLPTQHIKKAYLDWNDSVDICYDQDLSIKELSLLVNS